MSELLQIATKIALSALLAGAVGAEREWSRKWAGMRTHMLIAVGAALLTDLSIKIGPAFAGGSSAWDPGRIAAQIVTGVGFIGAGTIIQSRGAVHGLTTAAGLWVASAIGMAVGAEFFAEATLGTAALLLILAALKPVERRLFGHHQMVVLVLQPHQQVSEVARLFERAAILMERVAVDINEEGRKEVVVRFPGTQQDCSRLLLLAAEAGLGSRETE